MLHCQLSRTSSVVDSERAAIAALLKIHALFYRPLPFPYLVVFLGDIIFAKQEGSSLSAEWVTAQRENQGPLRLSSVTLQ